MKNKSSDGNYDLMMVALAQHSVKVGEDPVASSSRTSLKETSEQPLRTVLYFESEQLVCVRACVGIIYRVHVVVEAPRVKNNGKSNPT